MKIASFKYKNNYYRFLYYLLLIWLIDVLVIHEINSLNIASEVQAVLVFISINISSMMTVACLLLAYIHYKSPHYKIIIEDNMIIVPKKSIIPDSHFIHFNEIIFEGFFQSNKKYKIIYTGGVVNLEKGHLNSLGDWDKIVYCVKSELS